MYKGGLYMTSEAEADRAGMMPWDGSTHGHHKLSPLRATNSSAILIPRRESGRG